MIRPHNFLSLQDYPDGTWYEKFSKKAPKTYVFSNSISHVVSLILRLAKSKELLPKLVSNRNY